MSSKDKEKDKKKKAIKLEKKETKVINPSELESSQLIARVTNRLGDKETKNIANNEDDPYTKTFASFNTDEGAQLINFSGIQNQYQLNYNNQRSSDQISNQLKSESIQNFSGQLSQKPYYSQQIQSNQNYDQYYQSNYNFPHQEQRDYRYDQFRNQVNQSLLPKRQEILSQIQKIENRMEDIKYQTQKIENNTREECELIIGRLKSAEYQMLYSLYQDKEELISNIEQIDEISSRALYNNEQIPVANQFYNTERLLSQIKIKTQIDIYSNDLPQEMFQLKQLQLWSKNLQKLMDFKNEVIWKLINDSKIEQLKIKETNNEIQKWYNLVDQQQQELNKYKLQCIFCGINFDYQLINSNCDQNFQDAKLQFECQEILKKEFIGTQRHFFSKSQVVQQS